MNMQDNWGSILFSLFYLVLIWTFLIKLIYTSKKKGTLTENFQNHTWKWIFIPYFLLALGDIFHLISRSIVFFLQVDPNIGLAAVTTGWGAIITGITMTYFYIAIFYMWARLYGETYSTPMKIKKYTIILYVMFALRIVLVCIPWNHYFGGDSIEEIGFDFRIVSATPIIVIGLISISLLLSSAKKEKNQLSRIDIKINKGNFNASIWYIVSYASYIPAVLLVAIYPMIGMLYIVKTIAYLMAFRYHYKHVLNK